jgi:hypothetical protein
MDIALMPDKMSLAGQFHDPFSFVIGGAAGDMFSGLCWDESVDSVERGAFHHGG